MNETLTTPAIQKKQKAPHDIPYISRPNEISNDTYHNGSEYQDFISSTSLKHYMISPKYARWARENKKIKDSEALRFGSIYHDMLASLTNYGDLAGFEKAWAIFEPPVNPRTQQPFGATSQAYIDAYQQASIDADGRELYSQVEINKAKAMIEELLEGSKHLSSNIKRFIQNGKAEQSHFLTYQGQGFKYRTDLKTRKIILDWKTTTLEIPKIEHFPKQIIKLGYHISAAMYQFFEHELTDQWRKFYWVVQEKEPPYDFTILDSSEWTWYVHPDGEIEPKIGALEFIKLMEQHILCEEDQEWPGYSIFIQPDWKGYRIGKPGIPGYYKQREFGFYND